jgi:uncharacterized DUF497 family protein
VRVERGEEEIAFNWDEANIRHISRHGVKIEEAEQALRNDSYDLEYEVVDGEQRWTSLGHTDTLRVLIIVWTLRGEAVRVITARPASKKVQHAYFRQKGF